ncbi:MAG TPA: Holliday junction branch migration protein RuvA [Actinomycetota bacterium]
MISFIDGTLVEVLADGAVIEVGGMGYRLLMPVSSIADLPAPGKRIKVQTQMQVREDALMLYGFSTGEQRDLFGVLLGVAGIGPKGALAVLSIYSPDAFRKAVATEDLDALMLIPGVGKKTAARMILELREKLALPELAVVPGGSRGARGALVEVRGALLSLGYSAAEAREAIGKLDAGADEPVEALLKQALKELARA